MRRNCVRITGRDPLDLLTHSGDDGGGPFRRRELRIETLCRSDLRPEGRVLVGSTEEDATIVVELL